MPVRPISAAIEPTFQCWRAKARALLTAEVAPDAIVWSERRGREPLAAGLLEEPEKGSRPLVCVPRKFVALAELASCHHATDRWPLLYRILWRLAHENARLLDDVADRDIAKLLKMADDVRRDVERMQRFVRFRAIGEQHQEYFIGWHRAEHRIAPLVAQFFVQRYPNIRWSLFTPHATIHWDGHALSFGEGVAAHELPAPDSDSGAERLWRNYRLSAWRVKSETQRPQSTGTEDPKLTKF